MFLYIFSMSVCSEHVMLISPGGIVIGFRIFFNLWSTILKVDQYLLLEYLRKKNESFKFRDGFGCLACF